MKAMTTGPSPLVGSAGRNHYCYRHHQCLKLFFVIIGIIVMIDVLC